mmetsp:Transcript_123900/g.241340  ORF Transcript_123900/g.241340 Transcript_123900/m.241340 type:complete len:850 (+) Transcript_123900:76-2625(+)
MPLFAWREVDNDDDNLVGDFENVVSCPSAFEGETPRVLLCSATSSGDEDVGAPIDEFSQLLEERDRLLSQHRRAQRHRRRLKAHAESMEALLRHAYKEREQIASASWRMGGSLQTSPSPLEALNDSLLLRPGDLARRSRDTGKVASRLESVGEFRQSGQVKPWSSPSTRMARRHTLSEVTGASEFSSSEEEVRSLSSESEELFALAKRSHGSQQGHPELRLKLHAYDGEGSRHGNLCSSPSIASLSTRSGSQATCSTASLCSQRSGVGLAGLPSTPELERSPLPIQPRRRSSPSNSPLAGSSRFGGLSALSVKEEGGASSPGPSSRRLNGQASVASRGLKKEPTLVKGLSKVTCDRLKARMAEQQNAASPRPLRSPTTSHSQHRWSTPAESPRPKSPNLGFRPKQGDTVSSRTAGTKGTRFCASAYSTQRHLAMTSTSSTSSSRARTAATVSGPSRSSMRGAFKGSSTEISPPQQAEAITPPMAPPLSPQSAARQRRFEKESWARRGVSGASPPPRESGRGSTGQVRVVVRCRPPAPLVAAACNAVRTDEMLYGVHVVDPTTVEIRESGGVRASKKFGVDRAFGPTAKTSDVFLAVQGLAQAAISGMSAALLAYGPTGSGKTHTMYGSTADQGLVQRAAAELFGNAAGKPVRVSMLELHNETLIDLLMPKGQASNVLEVRGGSAGSMACIEGAREVPGPSLASLLVTIRSGLARRQVASTMANATSSRSHVIVVFVVGDGRLTLVDLAGLERVKRSGAEGSVLRETQSINRSLQSLESVVEALRRGSSHVPCRNSKLTRLLAGALGGGCESTVLVCVSPGSASRDEAVTALCFAEKVRRIPGSCKAGMG